MEFAQAVDIRCYGLDLCFCSIINKFETINIFTALANLSFEHFTNYFGDKRKSNAKVISGVYYQFVYAGVHFVFVFFPFFFCSFIFYMLLLSIGVDSCCSCCYCCCYGTFMLSYLISVIGNRIPMKIIDKLLCFAFRSRYCFCYMSINGLVLIFAAG